MHAGSRVHPSARLLRVPPIVLACALTLVCAAACALASAPHASVRRFVIDESKSNHSLLRDGLVRRGWVESMPRYGNIKRRLPFDFKWTWDFEYARVTSDEQIVNHFPNYVEITTKEGLHRNMLRARSPAFRADGPMPLAVDAFYPRSYFACNASLWQQDADGDAGAAQAIDGPANLWVWKPARGARGVGIEVMDAPTMQRALAERVTQRNCSDVIVQRYVERPQLIRGLKFDIRQFVLVVSLQPLVAYALDEFYLRFCTVPYSVDLHAGTGAGASADSAQFAHLTNHQVQMHSASYDATGIPGNQWSSDEFRAHLDDEAQFARVRERIHRMLVASLRVWPAAAGQRRASFELLGYDVLLDDGAHPWLIEINATLAYVGASLVVRDADRRARVAHSQLHLLTDTVRRHHYLAIEGLLDIVLEPRGAETLADVDAAYPKQHSGWTRIVP